MRPPASTKSLNPYTAGSRCFSAKSMIRCRFAKLAELGCTRSAFAALQSDSGKGVWKLFGPAHFREKEGYAQGPGRGLRMYSRWALPILLRREVGQPVDLRDCLL